MTAQELKNSILMRAVQGKLVPQDPNDEPASVLLAKIRAEKEQMMQEGKIKKEPISEIYVDPSDNQHYEKIGKAVKCIEDEIPFEIPESWAWCRLGSVIEIARGGSPRPIKAFLTNKENGINWIKIGDTDKNGKYINNTTEKIIPEGMTKSRFVHKGDFLLTNSMSFGRPYILNIDGCIHDGWLVFSDYTKIFEKEYLYYLLSSPFAYNQFCNKVSGAVVKNLNIEKVVNSIFPIPPIQEQLRIVNRIMEFEPVIAKYEYWDNQDKIIEKNILPHLKKSILQYAIQGKLVPQDPNDEPASVLLERIRAEKEQLIKEGKIKRDKNESYIYRGSDNSYYEKFADGREACIDEEIPFDIPESWCWCRLKSILTKIVDGDHNPPKGKDEVTLYKMLSSRNINNDGLVDLDMCRFLDKEIFEIENLRTNLQRGDILFTSVGSLGRSCVFDDGGFYCFQRSVSVLTTMIYNYYLKMVLDSPWYQNFIFKNATGTAQKGFYLNQLEKLIIPIPSLAEQNRIYTTFRMLIDII